MNTFVVESLVGQCEYITPAKPSFWCHVIDAKALVTLLIFTNEIVFVVLYLSFSLTYLVELNLPQSHKNEATWAQIWVISS